MSDVLSRELSKVPSLQDHWVAVDPRPSSLRSDRQTPLRLALKTGAVVVDADYELDVLCARLRATNQTSLTIVHVSSR